MLMAVDLSARHGWLDRADVQRTESILRQAGLPTRPPATMSEQQFMELMAVDKKVIDGGLRLVLLKRIGEAFVTADFQSDLLSETLTATASA
jgi:3-dehydroquinate synthase